MRRREGGAGRSAQGGGSGEESAGRRQPRWEESENFQREGIVGSSHGLSRAPHLSAAPAPALASRPRFSSPPCSQGGGGGRPATMIHFILLFSRQGKLRLQKWYITLPDKERKKITREIVQIILSRGHRTSSFVDWKELKLVYKRYASLYFCCAIENQDNELLTLEIVHRYVELLDKYFGNVCELDIIFNFEKAYFILDEFIIGGEIQETSKKIAVKAIEDSDMLQETMEEYMNKPTF
ncbi:AP-1 complex subunit sigma-3 isoform X1 [Piliocolobus tephrosceles]|uniref:Adaptor related protein complex 1 subunit sigma 3 n=1 Tax=Piliocolobus tephrosceles TaxID=591936 RepID=A0A8C9IXM3_9PRIM|nr:AP-1 complex subunit sigma-3 isoform X1 [Piliocolobus tephrosceles]